VCTELIAKIEKVKRQHAGDRHGWSDDDDDDDDNEPNE